MNAEAVADLYRELHTRHTILLDADGTTIRMANPFSGVATGFRVTIDRTQYWANCAWDALGIPAALHRNAAIAIDDPAGGTTLELGIVGGQLVFQATLALTSGSFGQWLLASPQRKRWLDRLMGVVYVGLALRLVTLERKS